MKRLVVLGAGESGVGTALLGKQKGYEVFVSDKGVIKENYKQVLIDNAIEWEQQQHTETKILNADVVVKSPGIPDKVALIQRLLNKGVSVISEIEFASQYTEATLVGITGSNGKTTTTLLTYHLLKSELNIGIAGNIGDSFAGQVAHNSYDNYVLELSSFQLDGIDNFKPHIAVITNLSEDHLDRYDYKYENYIASKFRITKNQTASDYLIYDADDNDIEKYVNTHEIKATLIPFSLTKKLEQGVYIDNNEIKLTINEETLTMPVKDLALEGKHNIKNAMASAAVANLLKIRKATIRESLSNFQGVEHRLEHVLQIQNVQYINDSKATNVNAVFYALDSMQAPTVWIVGGVDKGNDYTELLSLVNEKVKAIVCLGTDNKKIKHVFENTVETLVETTSMGEAVQMAYKLANKGDNVLLSPACASFDLFENYEDRGRQFKTAVRKL
ncbi:MAG: UDP-N-acetylmuramoyl-L-alanine--D-glutamate ligase [Flavobacteriaceae bacterium]